jgi:hypothetical protein
MGLLELNLNDVKELSTVEPGEYQLRITQCEVKTSEKTGGQFLKVLFDIPEEADSKGLSKVFMFPTDADDDKVRNNRLRSIKIFYEGFGIDYEGAVETDDLVGLTGWAILAEDEDPQYGVSNYVKRFVASK